MQITLTQAEIEQAISNFVTEQVNVREGHTLDIELKAGRGPEGYTATIEIVAPAVTVATRKTATKTETVAKAAPEKKDVAIPSEPEPKTPAEEKAQEEGSEETAVEAKSLFKNLNRPRNN